MLIKNVQFAAEPQFVAFWLVAAVIINEWAARVSVPDDARSKQKRVASEPHVPVVVSLAKAPPAENPVTVPKRCV